jgi:hypothetical protein
VEADEAADHPGPARVCGLLWDGVMHTHTLRISPGRIHHCMRSVGAAQMALDTMLLRVTDPTRKTFGKQLHEHGGRPMRAAGTVNLC